MLFEGAKEGGEDGVGQGGGEPPPNRRALEDGGAADAEGPIPHGTGKNGRRV